MHARGETSASIELLVSLRFTVGYLGERGQAGWWRSSFLSPEGRSFLNYAFVKTRPLAQYSGVTAAAARAHDERIGVGQHVYHLFRLPEALEQAAFRAMHDADLVAQFLPCVASREAAEEYLAVNAGEVSRRGDAHDVVGPIWVAATQGVYGSEAWARVAAVYLRGFRTGESVFPYFADRSP